MSILTLSPKGEEPKQPPVLMAYPLFGMIPGQLPGTATAIVQAGMSLRDYFAGQYLMTFVQSPEEPEATCEQVAIHCYRMADAMIDAMQRVQKGGSVK